MTTALRKKKKKPTGGWCLLFPKLTVRTTMPEAERREYCRAAAGLLLAFSLTDDELTAYYATRNGRGPSSPDVAAHAPSRTT